MNAVGGGDKFAALQALSSGATITFGDGDTAESADIAELVERCPGRECAEADRCRLHRRRLGHLGATAWRSVR